MTDDTKLLRDAIAAGPTPGPWTYFYKHKYNEHHVSVPLQGQSFKLALFEDGCPTERPAADAAYIAAASPDRIARLLDRLEAAERDARRWRPIETAPKDCGLLMWNGDFLTVGLWNSVLAQFVDCCETHGSVDFIDQPTHWMPLPDPPDAAMQQTPPAQTTPKEQ